MASPASSAQTLPHNLEAERSVLGAVLVDNSAINVALQRLKATDFYRDAHRRIFDAMIQLSEKSQAIDLVTVKEELHKSGSLESAGGPAVLAALTDGVPRSSNIEHFAARLSRSWRASKADRARSR